MPLFGENPWNIQGQQPELAEYVPVHFRGIGLHDF